MVCCWETLPGQGCRLANDFLTVNRVEGSETIPEFSVAMTGRLDEGDKEFEVFYSGDCNYFGIGVAESDIPTDESPRRLEQGRAWFFLNKGFLCNGRAFEDDTLEPGVCGNRHAAVKFSSLARPWAMLSSPSRKSHILLSTL